MATLVRWHWPISAHKSMLPTIKHLITVAAQKIKRTAAAEFSNFDRSSAVLFDRKFYLSTYPDIAAAGVDPFKHYLKHGYGEGRLPLDIHQEGAIERIRNALALDPANKVAVGLHLTCALLSGDPGQIDEALTSLNGADEIRGFTDIEEYLKLFEKAAVNIFIKRHRGEIGASFSAIGSSLEKMLNIFPDSIQIQAVLALAIFRTGRLKLAEGHFLAIKQRPELWGDLTDFIKEALSILDEARLVNLNNTKASDLLLLDSSFPSKISSFRYGEFLTYLDVFENSAMHCRPDNLKRFGEHRSFHEQIQHFVEDTGHDSNRIKYFDIDNIGTAKVSYCVFLNLADYFYTQTGLPLTDHYLFTLYPGGGFNLNDKASDLKLRLLCGNPKLKKIITTQIVTYHYLIDGKFCTPDRIEHIYGGIIPHIYNNPNGCAALKQTQKPLDVCFVAQRYSATGAEKGYDVFMEVVKKLANSLDVRFHVVGGFDASVIDIGNVRNITFHGTQNAAFFDTFYNGMDLILSPNIHASALNPSLPDAFDGFPTTAVVEAGLRGVAIFLTDFMNLNRRLDGNQIFKAHEMQLIDRNPDKIVDLIEKYIHDRPGLHAMGEAGRQAIYREFGFEMQMTPRIQLIEKYLRHEG